MPVAVGLVSQHQTKLIGNHLPKATKQEGENIRAARPQGARLVGSRKQQNERAGIEGRQAAPPHMRGGEDVREGWGVCSRVFETENRMLVQVALS